MGIFFTTHRNDVTPEHANFRTLAR